MSVEKPLDFFYFEISFSAGGQKSQCRCGFGKSVIE